MNKMAPKTEIKTNVMRLLEQKKVAYEHHCFEEVGATNGAEVAQALHQNPDRAFKTLVTVAKSKKNYVFMLPVTEEMDLKKAAHAVHEKSIDMLPAKELFALTGYVHGGCSPIGMKKNFETVIHESAQEYESILFSAGRVGHQVEMPLKNLQKMLPVKVADIIVEKGQV